MKRRLISATACVFFTLTGMGAVTPASYPGGEPAMNEYLSANMRYPETAKNHGIEGTVEVTFIVNTDGTLGAVKIVRMIDPDLENEALRLVKGMPKWQPATDNGTPVQSTSTVAVEFVL